MTQVQPIRLGRLPSTLFTKGIVVQCWYPLGGRGYTAELLGDETIKAIAEAHDVSSFCGGISDPDEANGKGVEKDEAYQFGKALQ